MELGNRVSVAGWGLASMLRSADGKESLELVVLLGDAALL